MNIPVKYQRPGHTTLIGHIVGASPVALGVLIMQLANGKRIAVDADFVTEIK